MKALRKIYYDPKTGFTSADKIYRKLKDLGESVTLNQVKSFINNQLTAQVNKPIKNMHRYNSIISPSALNNVQVDIMIYDRYQYGHYKYILNVIDVFSRKLASRAMTTRKLDTIMLNLKDIFKHDFKGLPKNINCDNEFNKGLFNKWCKTNHITTYFSFPDQINKNAIVERVNGTLALLINKVRIATNDYNWPKYLQDIVYNYNNTIHSTLKATPNDVFSGKASSRQKTNKFTNSFEINDIVRKEIRRKVLEKGDNIKYSKSLYTIVELVGNKYKIQNNDTHAILKNTFNEYELQKIDKVEVGNMKDDADEIVHIAKKKERKVNRTLNNEGVSESNKRTGLRSRNPDNLVEDRRYGRVLWS